MASPHYFEYLGTVWKLLPSGDQDRLAELWHGYEQVFAAVYQNMMEVNLNISVRDLQPYTTERWLPYEFNSSNFIVRAATVTSSQDLSYGISLLSRYLLKFKIDGGAAIEVDIRGANPSNTKLEEIVIAINLAAGFKFAKGIYEDTIIQLVSPTTGANSSIEILATSIPSANACEFVLGVDVDNLPEIFPKFRYAYQMPYEKVADVLELRDAIRDESLTITLESGIDYTVEPGNIIVFAELPVENMWAKRTQINEENPWNNFGYLLGIYQENSPRYVEVIQGLWFAFWTGPTPANVERALYLLFGLPTAKESCTVTDVTTTLIQTTSTVGGIVREFEIAAGLESRVTKGQLLVPYDPLVTGISVYDKINRPGFIRDEIGRAGIQRFLTENATKGYGDTDETKALSMLEEYTFLPQISVDAFVYPGINLENVKIFLDAIKPLNKTYLFQVIVGEFKDPLNLTEHTSYLERFDLTQNLDSNVTTFLSETTLSSYETIDDNDLNLDQEVVEFQEKVEVEVYQGAALIDSFVA
jgi:hypothetical protein